MIALHLLLLFKNPLLNKIMISPPLPSQTTLNMQITILFIMVIGPSGVQFSLWVIQVINNMRRPQSECLICLLRVWLLTELDDKKSCYQLIISKNFSSGDNVFKLNIPPFWKLPCFSLDKWLLLWLSQSILWLADLAEWTSYDWLLQLSDYSQLSNSTVRLQLYRMISEKLSSWCTNHIWGNCNGYD